MWNKNKIKNVFEHFAHTNPSPRTELTYSSPFELLVAVMLSAQTTDKRVNIVTKKLFTVANQPNQILILGEEGLHAHISSINFYPTKTKNILKTCQILIGQYQSKVPDKRIALESLPGVGRKTANVLLNVIFNQPEIAVDTHIFRVCNRLGFAKGKTPLEVEKSLSTIIPNQYKRNAHHWLVLHGRYVCKARKPNCAHCLINYLCDFNQQHNGI